LGVISASLAAQNEAKKQDTQKEAGEILARYHDPFKTIEGLSKQSGGKKSFYDQAKDKIGKMVPKQTSSKDEEAQEDAIKLLKFTLLGYAEDASGKARGILGIIKNGSELSSLVVQGGEKLNLSADDTTVEQYHVIEVKNDYITLTSQNHGVVEVR